MVLLLTVLVVRNGIATMHDDDDVRIPCSMSIVSPKQNETLYQLALLPMTSDKFDPLEIFIQFNTTCFTPVHIYMDCISEVCGNEFRSMEFHEMDYNGSDNYPFRSTALPFHIHHGNYELRIDNITHYFTVEKKYAFRTYPTHHRYIEHDGFDTLGLVTTYGRGSFWDLSSSNAKIYDFLTWTVEIGSFCSFGTRAKLLLSYKGGLHRTDFISHVSFHPILCNCINTLLSCFPFV